jgi:FtsH-binding integral membrane protein
MGEEVMNVLSLRLALSGLLLFLLAGCGVVEGIFKAGMWVGVVAVVVVVLVVVWAARRVKR